MDILDFRDGMNLLADRFGKKHFDDGFRSSVWREVSILPKEIFDAVLISFLGDRRPTKPPLLEDFKKAIHQEMKKQPKKYVTKNLDRGDLQSYLENAHPGCKSLAEAVEIEVKIKRELEQGKAGEE
jgi:hypothetical protein